MKKRRKRKVQPIAVNLTNCKYELLRIVQRKLGWREVGDDDDWQLYWTDTSVSIERIMRLKSTQKINHFTGMLEICRKKQLAKNLGRMSAMFPEEFKFAPKTFVLPVELNEFLESFKGKKRKTFILKPDAGCQGKGIALAQTADQAMKALEDIGGEEGYKTSPVVAQRYLTKPFLIDGFKFDLRIYALVLCCDPLRIHVFNDGLARFCTEKYEAPKPNNLKDVCMHLTNYAVNKHNENFVFNEDAGASDEGSKWSIQGLKEWMETNGHDFCGMWAEIVDLIVKTVISIQPLLAHNYHSVLPPENDGYSCFEILGLDVMMDTELRPWLIEVNHSPSFTVDTPLDLSIKEDLISDTIELVRIDPKAIKRAQAEEKAEAQSRLMGGAGGTGSSGRITREEIEEKRAAALAAREKWEEKHSGSYEIAYPSPDPIKQELYERLLEGAREAFNTHGSHSRVRDTLERAKAQAQRKASEEEAKAEAAKNGLKAPAGAKLRRAVDAAMAGKNAAEGRQASSSFSSSATASRSAVGRRGSTGGGGGVATSEQLGEQSDEGQQFRLYYPSEMLGLGGTARGGNKRNVTAFTAAAIARSSAAAASAAAAAADGTVAVGSPPSKGGGTKYGRRANTNVGGGGGGGGGGVAATDHAAAYLEASTAYHRRYHNGAGGDQSVATVAPPSLRRNSGGCVSGGGHISPNYTTFENMMAHMVIADDLSAQHGSTGASAAALRRALNTAASPGLVGGVFGAGHHHHQGGASRPGSGSGVSTSSRRPNVREVNPQPTSVASMAAAHAAQYTMGGIRNTCGAGGGVSSGSGLSENRQSPGCGAYASYAYASSSSVVPSASRAGDRTGEKGSGLVRSSGGGGGGGGASDYQHYAVDNVGGTSSAYGYGLAHQPQHHPRYSTSAKGGISAGTGGGVMMGLTGGAGGSGKGSDSIDFSSNFCRSMSLSARRRGLTVTGTKQVPLAQGGGGGGGVRR